MYAQGPSPYYGGLVSFFRTPGIEYDQIQEGMAVVAGVPLTTEFPPGGPGRATDPERFVNLPFPGEQLLRFHQTIPEST